MTTNDLKKPSDSRLRIRVFGPQAQKVQCDVLDLARIEFPVTAKELLNQVALQFPELAPSISVSRIAVDHEFVDEDQQISSGCEVALVGLISGG